jgi:hypothetical protein
MKIIERLIAAVDAFTENRARLDELTKRVADLERQVASIPSWPITTADRAVTSYNIVPPLPR